MSAESELFGFSLFFGALYLAIAIQCWISVARSSHCLRKREITDICCFNVLLGAFALARVAEMVLSLLDTRRFDDDMKTESLLVHRAASCLWFASISHVVAQWLDVVNASGSRKSRLIWWSYAFVLVTYVLLEFLATLVALEWVQRGNTQIALLDLPDIARTSGEVLSLIGFVTAGVGILKRYVRLPAHFRDSLRNAVRSLAAVIIICAVFFMFRWALTMSALVRTFESADARSLKLQILIYQCGLGRLACEVTAEWVPEVVSALCIMLLQWRERKERETPCDTTPSPAVVGTYGSAGVSPDAASGQAVVPSNQHESHVFSLQRALADAAALSVPLLAEHDHSEAGVPSPTARLPRNYSGILDSMEKLERLAARVHLNDGTVAPQRARSRSRQHSSSAVEPRSFPFRPTLDPMTTRLVHDAAPSVLQVCVAVRVDGVLTAAELAACFATVECCPLSVDGITVDPRGRRTMFRSEAIWLRLDSADPMQPVRAASRDSLGGGHSDRGSSSPSLSVTLRSNRLAHGSFLMLFRIELPVQQFVDSGSVTPVGSPAGMSPPIGSPPHHIVTIPIGPSDQYVVNHGLKFQVYFASNLDVAEDVPTYELSKIRHLAATATVGDSIDVMYTPVPHESSFTDDGSHTQRTSAAMYYGTGECLVSDLLDSDDGEFRMFMKRNGSEIRGSLTAGVVALKRGNAERVLPLLRDVAPVSKSEEAPFGGRVSRFYLLPTMHASQLLVEEDLRESTYVFDVPAKMLRLLIADKQHKLVQLRAVYRRFSRTLRSWGIGKASPGKKAKIKDVRHLKESLLNAAAGTIASGTSSPHSGDEETGNAVAMSGTSSHLGGTSTFADLEHCIRESEDITAGHRWLDSYIRRLTTYIEHLETCSRVGAGGRGPGGITFKRSTQKATPGLEFLPVNLNLQEMRVRELPGLTYGPDEAWFPRGIVAMEHTLRQWTPLAGRASVGRIAAWNLSAGLSSHAAISVKAPSHSDAAALGLTPDLMIQHEASEHIYDTITVGAFAAHTLKFKAGIKQLLDQRKAHDRQASSDAGKARGTASTTQEFATSDTRRQENDQLLEIEMRSDIVLCQAVTTLVTCFVRKLRLVQRYMSPTAGRRLLSQYHQVGFFVGFESLLSTAGSEYGMLGDHVMGVRWLSKFSFRLKPPPSRTSAVSPSSRPTGVLSRRSEGWFSLGREYGTSDWMEGGGVEIVQESENHYVIEVQLWQMEGSDTADRPGIGGFSSLFNRFVPKELLSGETIRVCPVLFSQGINERQTIANLIGRSSELQTEINVTSLKALQAYYDRYRRFYDNELEVLKTRSRLAASAPVVVHPPGSSRRSVASASSSQSDRTDGGVEDVNYDVEIPRQEAKAAAMAQLVEDIEATLVLSSTGPRLKNLKLLKLVNVFTRQVHGGRVTSCKSAKDRTSMALTYEQAWILEERHGLRSSDRPVVANLMRRHGVRRANCERNVGRAKYAFNTVQKYFLPEELRPPAGTAGGVLS